MIMGGILIMLKNMDLMFYEGFKLCIKVALTCVDFIIYQLYIYKLIILLHIHNIYFTNKSRNAYNLWMIMDFYLD